VILADKQDALVRKAAMSQGLDSSEMAKKMRAGTLSDEEKRKLGLGAGFAGFSGFNEFEREFQGAGKTDVPINKKAIEGGGVEADSKDLKLQLDALRTSGFSQAAEAAASAAKELGGFSGALAALTAMTKNVAKDGDAKEDAFRSAAGEMAKSFNTTAVKFDASTDKMNTASDKLIKAAGIVSNGYAVIPKVLTDYMNRLDKFKGVK
jgi:hypothetical protein